MYNISNYPKLYIQCIKIIRHDLFVLVQQSSVQNTDSDSQEKKPRRSRPRSDINNCEIEVISGNLQK